MHVLHRLLVPSATLAVAVAVATGAEGILAGLPEDIGDTAGIDIVPEAKEALTVLFVPRIAASDCKRSFSFYISHLLPKQ